MSSNPIVSPEELADLRSRAQVVAEKAWKTSRIGAIGRDSAHPSGLGFFFDASFVVRGELDPVFREIASKDPLRALDLARILIRCGEGEMERCERTLRLMPWSARVAREATDAADAALWRGVDARGLVGFLSVLRLDPEQESPGAS